MPAPSKLPLPIKALAALTTIPANVFCNYLANIMAGGWTAMQAVDSKTFVAAAAVAGLFGWIRHLTNRDEKEKEQLARAIRAIKCDVRTASEIIEGIAKGRIEVSFTIDELMKSEIEDACRRIVAAPTAGLSDQDAATILDALHRTATREQLEAFEGRFDERLSVLETLGWTQDHRGREHDVILRETQESVARMDVNILRLGDDEETVRKIVHRYESVVGERDRRIGGLEQENATLRTAVERVGAQAAGGDPKAKTAIEEARRSGDVTALQAVLITVADRRENEIKTSAVDYLDLCREIAAIAFLRGDIEEANKRLSSILRLLPHDLDALNSLSHIHYIRGDLPEAEKCCKRVLEFAGDDESVQAVAYGNLGVVYRTRGDLDGAEAVYKKALAIDEKLGHPEGMASIYTGLGNICYTRGDLDAAEGMYKKALAINEKLGRLEGMAYNYTGLGNVYVTRGDLDGAEEMHQKSLAIEEKLGRLEGMASAYGNLGNVYQTRGDLDAAEAMYKKALVIDEKLGRLEGMTTTYSNLGKVYQTRGDLDRADAMYKKALANNEKLGRPEGMAIQYGNLGNVCYRRDDLDGADAMYKKSLAIKEKLGRPEGMAVAYGNLGNVCSRRGDLDRAEAMYKKALAINEKLGRPEGMAIQYGNLGILYKQRGDMSAARECWTKARDLFQKAQMPHKTKKMQDQLHCLPPTAASAPPL
jgi:tetratricopeptide (TPR) repeat protein